MLALSRQGACGRERWKSLMALGECSRFDSGSQVQSTRFGYPFHLTRYWSFLLYIRESRISSTSNSSTSFTITGGGLSGCCWEGYLGSLYGVRRDSLNTGWIFFKVNGRVRR